MTNHRSLRLLLIESDPSDAARLIKLIQNTMEPPEVIHAHDVTEALPLMAGGQVDAVLHSFTIVAEVRTIAARAGRAPIIAICPEWGPAKPDEAVEAGACGAYRKRRLLSRVPDRLEGLARRGLGTNRGIFGVRPSEGRGPRGMWGKMAKPPAPEQVAAYSVSPRLGIRPDLS